MENRPIFISYSHDDVWVLNRLIPSLSVAGCEVFYDRQDFAAASDLRAEIAKWQQRAAHHILVLTPNYLKSKWCLEEMECALATRKAIPVLRAECDLQEIVKLTHIDLQSPEDAEAWGKLLEKCQPQRWLSVVDRAARYLTRNQSIHIQIEGDHLWKPLLDQISEAIHSNLPKVDLEGAETSTRPSFVREILKACAVDSSVPSGRGDLVPLADRLVGKPKLLAFVNFDYFPHKKFFSVETVGALRNLMHSRKLVVVIQSRASLGSLLPTGCPYPLDLPGLELRGGGHLAD